MTTFSSKFVKFFSIFYFICFLLACQNKKESSSDLTAPTATNEPPVFKKLDAASTGVSFENNVKDQNDLNAITFTYLYNGGGLAVGDINNDGLEDIYFVSTQGNNKLYLNKGNLKFEDITQTSGTAAAEGIKTGVTMVDINADGFMDIYACRTGLVPEKRSNFLFINNKNLTFTESSKAYGLDDQCASNHANFFDYDGDGDLDMYLLNHLTNFMTQNKVRVSADKDGKLTRRTTPDDAYESDRLYRNNGNNTFTDVSKQAGIYNRAFGLSCTVTDINNDGFPDIYIANDFLEPDFLYINNKNGTFSNRISDYFRHTVLNGMGVDIADINNDGLPDVMQVDMNPESNQRQKQLGTVMKNDRVNALIKYGYGEQLMRNVLQINTGKGFSDIGELAHISDTDWSWAPIMMDFDNDGKRDIFITNGYRRDLTDNDYVNFTLDSMMRAGSRIDGDINNYLDKIPSNKIQNYCYQNNGNFNFTNKSDAWGFAEKTFANGCVYADLDNDGDLELIINNIGDLASIFENKSNEIGKNNFLQLELRGEGKNTNGTGAAVRITYNSGEIQYQELTPTRGFFSSVQHLIHFGLGQQTLVDKVEIRWADGKTQTLTQVKANQKLTVKHADAQKRNWAASPKATPIFEELNAVTTGIDFIHQENEFTDYDRELLIPHKLSALGPCIAVGDVNADSLEDFYVGGAANEPAALFVQSSDSKFHRISEKTWEADKQYEEMGATFFDADGDKDLDLYVVSGGNTHPQGANIYENHLYLNDGKGNFTKAADALPHIGDSGSCVATFDYDGDGDLDIFVGGRVVAGAYPISPNSFILQNNNGKFSDVTAQVAPEFQKGGMVCAIQFADLDKDGKAEMIVSGEWMPITIYKWSGTKFINATAAFGFENSNGWWNTILATDMDGDGDIDLVCGNLGANSRLRATATYPLQVFSKDFDNNGSTDPIMAYYNQGKCYPLVQKELLTKQIPSLKKRFLRYQPYSVATIEDIYPKKELESSLHLFTKNLKTTYFQNEGNGKFTAKVLPAEIQFAPVYKIIAQDFNHDGFLDLLAVGNDYSSEVETGRYDASNGTLLIGDGKGGFKPVANRDCGFWAGKEAKDLANIHLKNGKQLFLVANNNDKMQIFTTAATTAKPASSAKK